MGDVVLILLFLALVGVTLWSIFSTDRPSRGRRRRRR